MTGDRGGIVLRLLFLVVLIAGVAVVGTRMMATRDTAPPTTTAADGDRRPSGQGTTQDRFIASVEPVPDGDGTSYQIRPTRAGRLADRAQLDIAWEQAVALGVPDRPGLRQQFLCHPLSMIARAKPTWDVETWRPTVGAMRTMLMACNP